MTNKELPDTEETLLMPHEAARMLHVTTKTLQRMAIHEKIAAIVLPSGHRRYRLDEIDRLRAGMKSRVSDAAPGERSVVSVQKSREGFRVREPEQHPARTAVRSEADLSLDGESLPADAAAQPAPLRGDAGRQVAEGLLRDDLDRVGVGTVAGFGFEDEPVGADRGDVALSEVRALDGDVVVAAVELEVPGHGAELTQGVAS
jgi:hypothetical protein